VRKIIVTMWITLDGFVAGPDDEMDWLRLDNDVQAYETDLVSVADTLMLGRVTFNDFGGYWPRVARDTAEEMAARQYAQILDGMEKIAVSASGQLTEWNNTCRWPSVDTDTVRDLKNSPGRDIVVYGSLSLVDTLTELGLVDEYHLLVHPVILRDGKPLLRPGRPAVVMQHLSTRMFSSGVALNKYQPTIPRSPAAPNAASTTNG
jgi:dihydrofolate reductase